MPSVPAEPPPTYVATTPMILVPGIKSTPTRPTELLATLHPLTSEIGTLPSRPNRYWFRDKTRDTVVSWYSNSQLGIPPISRITIWLMLRQLQPPLLLGGLPMDPGLLFRHVTCLVSDICHATPASQTRECRQASPADGHPASTTPSPGGSYQDPTMYSRPASTTSVPGGSYQDTTVNSLPTSTNSLPGGSYQTSPMNSHPTSTPARSECSNPDTVPPCSTTPPSTPVSRA